MRSGERSKRSIGWPGKGHTRPSVRRDAQGYVYIGTDSVCVCDCRMGRMGHVMRGQEEGLGVPQWRGIGGESLKATAQVLPRAGGLYMLRFRVGFKV